MPCSRPLCTFRATKEHHFTILDTSNFLHFNILTSRGTYLKSLFWSSVVQRVSMRRGVCLASPRRTESIQSEVLSSVASNKYLLKLKLLSVSSVSSDRKSPQWRRRFNWFDLPHVSLALKKMKIITQLTEYAKAATYPTQVAGIVGDVLKLSHGSRISCQQSK